MLSECQYVLYSTCLFLHATSHHLSHVCLPGEISFAGPFVCFKSQVGESSKTGLHPSWVQLECMPKPQNHLSDLFRENTSEST